MYWNILDQKRILLLKDITEHIDIGICYLAGGTALSLQLGLRESVDFDFFVPHKFNPYDLYQQLQKIALEDVYAINVDHNGTCDVSLDGVQVSFFAYPYRMIYDYVRTSDMPKLLMAGVRDIAAMKALAIGGRGAKKDFFDLYQILKRTDYCTMNLIHDLRIKYGANTNFSYIGMGMSYFDDAEQELLPKTFVKYDWESIKKFFCDIQKEFMNLLS